MAGFCEHGNEPTGSIKEAGYFLTGWVTISFSNNVHHGVSTTATGPTVLCYVVFTLLLRLQGNVLCRCNTLIQSSVLICYSSRNCGCYSVYCNSFCFMLNVSSIYVWIWILDIIVWCVEGDTICSTCIAGKPTLNTEKHQMVKFLRGQGVQPKRNSRTVAIT
jgi:hypothetical protein